MIFTASVQIQAPVEIVFAFHERPDALDLLLPKFPPSRVLRREGGLQPGAIVELRFGPIEWHARHTAYERDRLFVDEQTRGPFARWVHRHEFAAEGRGTRLTDRVDYELPAALAPFGWAVRLSLKRMFAERHRITREACESCASDMST